MLAGWDQVLVFLLVGGAALYLLRRRRARRGGCSGCSGSPSEEAPAPSPLVQLEIPPPRERAP